MGPDVRQVSCPNCAAPLDLLNGRKSKTLVCSNCGSQLDLSRPEVALLSAAVLPPAPPRTPIQLGMTGSFQDQQWQVIGRIRYSEQGAFWDEWLLMSTVGEFLWLTEGEAGFSLYDPVVPSDPIDPTTIRDTLTFNELVVPVRSRGIGRIVFLEGELTWKAQVGDSVNYVDAQFGSTKYALEWTESEIEYFKGQKIEENAVRAAFNLPAAVPQAVASPGGKRDRRGTILLSVVIVLIVLVCICLALAVIFAEDSDEENSGGTSSGPIIVTGGSGGSRPTSGGVRPSSGGSRPSSGGSSSGGGK